MKPMVALGIGASLMCATGCVPDTGTLAFSSIPELPSSIDAAHLEPWCFVDLTLDRGCPITAYLPLAGWFPHGGIGYTDCFSLPTTVDTTDA